MAKGGKTLRTAIHIGRGYDDPVDVVMVSSKPPPFATLLPYWPSYRPPFERIPIPLVSFGWLITSTNQINL